MRTMTIEKTVFAFDELSDDAKAKARYWWRECEAMEFSGFAGYDYFMECAERLGIEFRMHHVPLMGGGLRADPVIYWSGFSSQSDGACFEGTYRYRKGAAKLIRQHAPKDETLHRIADDLQRAQARAFYSLSASMRHRGHYYHSGCMFIDVEDSRDPYRDIGSAEDDIQQAMRDFADWIYRQIEREYEWRMSDENVDEAIRANGYEFNEYGDIA